MNRSDPFGPDRWIAALAFLVVGFVLLAIALLMDARLTPSPYPSEPTEQHGH